MRISFEYNKDLKERAGGLRRKGNIAEIILWKQLKDRKFDGLLFHKEKVIGNFIADFCCEEKKIVIEVDGNSHDEKEEYDEQRDEILNAMGFRIVRVSAANVKFNLDFVLEYIRENINV